MALGDGKAKKEVQDVKEELGFVLDAVSSIGDRLIASFEEAVDSAGDLNSAADLVGKTIQRGLAADLKSSVKSTENLIVLSAKLSKGAIAQKDISKEQERISTNLIKISEKRKIFAGKLTDEQQELLMAEEEELKTQQQIANQLAERNKYLQTTKSLLDIAKENASGLADKIDKTGTLSQVLNGGIGSVLTGARLLELAVVGVFNAMKGVDEQAGILAKNLNISYNEAVDLQSELLSAANTSGTLSITAKGLGEALMAANGELGIFNTTIDDNLILFQKLHKTAGLTYEELSGVKSITDATGGDLEKNTKEIMAQARLTGQRLGVALNEKDVLKDISNVSKATTLSLGKNPGQIANAVAAAKALGMEMSKVEGIADSLLNFEQSIQKELEAEMLLGKDINLEKARQAALNNDIAGVAEEIAKQAGSAADFAKMNRIQQEALAGAVGMSREDLAKSLFVQEQIGNLTGEEYELRKKQINELEAKGLSQAEIKTKLGKESLNDLKNQNSIQENLKKSAEKLNQVFASLAIPIMQIVTPIIELLVPAVEMLGILLLPITEGFKVIGDSVSSVYGFITGTTEELSVMQGIIGGIVTAYGTYYALSKGNQIVQGVILAVKAKQNLLAQKELFTSSAGLTKTVGMAIFSAISSFSKIPFGVGVGLGLVAAAGIASMASKYLSGDDIMSPGSNSSGYGSRTLFGPEGAIALNNKDTVIAGTDLFKGNDVISAPAGAVQMPDDSEGKRTNALLEALINKPAPKVQMDSIEVGTVAGMSAFSIQ
tara:strand:+ start:311 stop:2635 length:2325 start_codon:yes stop_codon:yes gene_type:complete